MKIKLKSQQLPTQTAVKTLPNDGLPAGLSGGISTAAEDEAVGQVKKEEPAATASEEPKPQHASDASAPARPVAEANAGTALAPASATPSVKQEAAHEAAPSDDGDQQAEPAVKLAHPVEELEDSDIEREYRLRWDVRASH